MPLIAERAAWLEQLCAQTPGEIAHLGCADSPYTAELLASGSLLHARLVRVGRVTGFDVDAPALALVQSAMPDQRFVLSDASDASEASDVSHASDVGHAPAGERGRYALVIAGEVLEHVPDADAFLRGCGALLAPGGQLCVTVPNACSPKIGLRSLAGRESVHPDHRVYYGPRTLERTLAGAGFELSWLASCFAPIAGRAGRTIFNPLLRLDHRLFHGPVGDGLIALASARSNAAAIAS
jgi:SAM-dependent methyltransferase